MAETAVRPIAALAQELAAGKTTSRRLVEAALARIADAGGEGGRVFTKVHAQGALVAADASDRLRKEGVVPSPLAGLPVSIKDLFDIAGEVTTAGSKILRDAPPATADAVAVARLRAAGAVVIGRSNMTEFAFSAIGINPHYGTPANPYDRGRRRIPGGSSSGAAVSVADGMAAFALGTHTGGAVRDRRVQADAAARSARRGVSALDHPRFRRAARAHGCLLRNRLSGARGRAAAPRHGCGVPRGAPRRAEKSHAGGSRHRGRAGVRRGDATPVAARSGDRAARRAGIRRGGQGDLRRRDFAARGLRRAPQMDRPRTGNRPARAGADPARRIPP